jgi:hypothetical protein
VATTTRGTGCGSARRSHDEQEYDLAEHRKALTPLLAALPDRERRTLQQWRTVTHHPHLPTCTTHCSAGFMPA